MLPSWEHRALLLVSLGVFAWPATATQTKCSTIISKLFSDLGSPVMGTLKYEIRAGEAFPANEKGLYELVRTDPGDTIRVLQLAAPANGQKSRHKGILRIQAVDPLTGEIKKSVVAKKVSYDFGRQADRKALLEVEKMKFLKATFSQDPTVDHFDVAEQSALFRDDRGFVIGTVTQKKMYMEGPEMITEDVLGRPLPDILEDLNISSARKDEIMALYRKRLGNYIAALSTNSFEGVKLNYFTEEQIREFWTKRGGVPPDGENYYRDRAWFFTGEKLPLDVHLSDEAGHFLLHPGQVIVDTTNGRMTIIDPY